jgi:REP element-mobilizing transposase RayT
MRKEKFQTGEYYHIYNRGVDKREIFCDEKDFVRFLRSMRGMNNILGDVQRDYIKRHKNSGNLKSDFGYPKSDFLPLVEIISFCLNQNHYHFILKQLVDGGITLFMRKLATGYTKYFNIKHNRSGVLFQGKFKSIHAKDYGHLLKLMVYVNCNYEVHNLGKAENWAWSSYLDASGRRKGNLCNFDIIKEEFKTAENFKNFCEEIISEIKSNKNLQKYLLE